MLENDRILSHTFKKKDHMVPMATCCLQINDTQGAYFRWSRAAVLTTVIAASAAATLYAEKVFFKKPYHTCILSERMCG
jgi:hypothetical protein